MNITSIIATSGRPELLRRTLASLERARKPEGYRGLIVVENGARRDCADLLRGLPLDFPVEYVHIPDANKSRALNEGIRRVERGLIYFHDDDVRLDDGALVGIAAAAAKHGARHFFGGPLGVDREREPPPWLEKRLPFSSRGWESPFPYLEDGCGLFFMGANWAAFADDLRATSVFSVDCGPNQTVIGEETLLQTEMMKKGFRGVYVPEARVSHYVPAERSSPAWALSRARKVGVFLSLFQSRNNPDFSSVMWRDCGQGLSFLFQGLVGRRADLVFEGRFRLWTFLGKVEGLARRTIARPKAAS